MKNIAPSPDMSSHVLSDSPDIHQVLARKLNPLLQCDLLSEHFRAGVLGNAHTNKYIAYSKDFCRPAKSKVEAEHAIILLFANRSGSNFLAHLLKSTGYYNSAGECFNWGVVYNVCKKQDIHEFGSYLDTLKRRGHNGRICVKAALNQFLFLYASSFLESHFPRRTVVVVERGDKLSQAVSHWIALHTKQWTSEQESSWTGEVPFDAEKISKLMERGFADERDTRVALSLIDQQYMTARYEEFLRDPNYTVGSILHECGITAPVELDQESLKIKKQSSDLNASLRNQFIARYSPPS